MWDQRYTTETYIYGTDPNRFLSDNVGTLPKGKVLCLAEGEGRNAVYLAKQGYQVTAVDSSTVGLEKANRLAAKHQVEIKTQVADLAEYDLGVEQWDAIVAIFAHLPPQLRASVHQRSVIALKTHGVFLLEAYTPDQLNFKTGGPPNIESLMTAQVLEKELTGLRFEHLEHLVRDVIEGVGHTGQGAVVQLIGRKS